MTEQDSIYLDNHATTCVDPRVVEAMLPFFTEIYGNPASKNHAFGWEAEKAVKSARRQVASLIGATDREVIFTSGATESNNLAIKGVAAMHHSGGGHIVTVATEHKAVLDPCKRLEHQGSRVTYVPVDRDGMLDPQQLADAITDDTILVSVMAANNEIGVVQPLGEIGAICRARGVLFHSDAAQAIGKIAIDVEAMGVDLLSLSAHKLYGPKGIGALYVRRGTKLGPMIDGGGHERGLRSGTLPTPLAVGFGVACEIAEREMTAEAKRLRALRERLKNGVFAKAYGVGLNGHPIRRLPGNLNLSFAGASGHALMMNMKRVAVSSGSACTTARLGPSHVLKAIGLDDDLAESSLRFGIGRFNTEEEIEAVIEYVAEAVGRCRAASAAS